jgi:hypothetical protein
VYDTVVVLVTFARTVVLERSAVLFTVVFVTLEAVEAFVVFVPLVPLVVVLDLVVLVELVVFVVVVLAACTELALIMISAETNTIASRVARLLFILFLI